jgi:cytochrome c553
VAAAAVEGKWRSPVLALAAALLCVPVAAADMTVADRTAQCSACHGEDGNSRIERTPSLAGQPEFFLLNQLILMREGVRVIEVMTPFVKDLRDSDIEALAKHFSALAPKPSGEPIDPKLAARGAELSQRLHCGSCHRPDLAGQDQMPRIAGQRVDYVIQALEAFRDNTRSGADTLMSAAVYGLTDADLAALAHYAASR